MGFPDEQGVSWGGRGGESGGTGTPEWKRSCESHRRPLSSPLTPSATATECKTEKAAEALTPHPCVPALGTQCKGPASKASALDEQGIDLRRPHAHGSNGIRPVFPRRVYHAQADPGHHAEVHYGTRASVDVRQWAGALAQSQWCGLQPSGV
jgi:hypothetical protein